MTTENFESKIEFLLTRVDSGVKESIKQECKRLAESGGINITDAENDFVIPMIVMQVALENIAKQFDPPGKHWQKMRNNLRNF